MKFYRFDYSCYARKVQMVLELLRQDYETVEVVYGNRTEFAKLTNGYIQVPVLIDEQGRVLTDSLISVKLFWRERGEGTSSRSLCKAPSGLTPTGATGRPKT